jgi:predicted ATPase
VLPVALPLRARRSRDEATEQAGQCHRKAEVRRPTGKGEERFWRVAEMSRRQQAKSLELQATVSFRPSLATQSKQEEYHRILSSICDWFAEGFDTKDLQEAKALLEELR